MRRPPVVTFVTPLLVLLSLVRAAASLGPSAPHHSLQTMRLRGGAEVGKGDKRWIVQDREDGQNVGSWHWEERNMLPWAKEQLPRLALGARGEMSDFEGYSGHFEVTNITTLTGDCVIHLRKGRLWPLCDLNVALAIKGTCHKDGKDTAVAGSIAFPEVTMDDRDELEVKATASSRGEASEVFGRWLRKEGYKTVEKVVKEFLDALHAKAGQVSFCLHCLLPKCLRVLILECPPPPCTKPLSTCQKEQFKNVSMFSQTSSNPNLSVGDAQDF